MGIKDNEIPVLMSMRYKKPVQSTGMILRQELIAHLSSITSRGIVSISAPAGYGKTSLISTWADGQKNPVSWVSLDTDANNPIRFWGYIVASIHEAYNKFPQEDLLNILINDRADIFVIQFLNALHQLPVSCTLVIEDFHTICNDEIIKTVTYFCLNLPVNCHLIISSRHEIPFSLAKMQIEGRMHQITKNDLKFTHDEVKQLALQKGIQLDLADIELIMKKTEGWPGGIVLILLSRGGKHGFSETLEKINHYNSFADDYFTEELISRIDQKTRDFLIYTSALPYMQPEICDLVLQSMKIHGVRSAEMLHLLWKDHIFVERINTNRYRYHPMFREVLRHKFQSAYPGQYAVVCETAMNWFAHRGENIDAADLAIRSEKYEFVVEFIESNYEEIILDGDFYLLNQWFGALPSRSIDFSPKMHLAKAWAMFSVGDIHEVDKHLDISERQLENQENQKVKDRERLLHKVSELRALSHSVVLFDSKDSLERSNKIHQFLVRTEDSSLAASANLIDGIVHLLQGEPSESRVNLQKNLISSENKTSVFHSFFANCFMATLEWKKGNLQRAVSYLNNALHVAKNVHGQERAIAGIAHMILAKIYYEWNRLDESLSHAKAGLAHADLYSLPYSLSLGYHTLALISILQGDLEATLETSQKNYMLAQTYGNYASLLITHEPLHTLKYRATLGSMEDSFGWAEKHLFDIKKDKEIVGEKLWQTPAALRLSMVSNNSCNSDEILEALLKGADRVGFHHQVIETQVLRSLIHMEQGRMDQAMDALASALELAKNEGYIRLFLDEGEPMRDLLKELKKREIFPIYTERILRAFRNNNAAKSIKDDSSPLSSREMDVLQKLADGYKPNQISELLYISIGTTRSHLHSIYSKLDAENQAQAIYIAREMKLI